MMILGVVALALVAIIVVIAALRGRGAWPGSGHVHRSFFQSTDRSIKP